MREGVGGRGKNWGLGMAKGKGGGRMVQGSCVSRVLQR